MKFEWFYGSWLLFGLIMFKLFKPCLNPYPFCLNYTWLFSILWGLLLSTYLLSPLFNKNTPSFLLYWTVFGNKFGDTFSIFWWLRYYFLGLEIGLLLRGWILFFYKWSPFFVVEIFIFSDITSKFAYYYLCPCIHIFIFSSLIKMKKHPKNHSNLMIK